MTILVPIGYDAAIEAWGPSWFRIWNRPYGHCQPSRKLAGKYEGFTYMSMHSWLVPDHVNPRGSSYRPVRLLGHPRDPSILCYRIRWPPKYYIPIGMMLQNAHQHQTPRLFFLTHSSMMSKMHISTIPQGSFSSSTRYVLRFYYQFSPHCWSCWTWTRFSNMVSPPVA